MATFACAVFLDRVEDRRRLEFDWTGFVALSVVLLAVQMALNRGQRLDWLESREILGWLALAALALSVYLGHTLTSRLRFIRWEVLRDWNFSHGLVLCSLMSGMSLAPMVLIPPMLTSLKGLEVDTIGLVFVFRGSVQIVVMMLLGPFLMRSDPRWLCAFGYLVFATDATWSPATTRTSDCGTSSSRTSSSARELLHVDVHFPHALLHREGGLL